MFTAAILMLKGFFGSIFSFIFKDWRITALVIILVFGGYGYMKYNKVQKHLADTQVVLKTEQDANVVLRNSLALASAANKANDKILKQVQEDNTLTRKQLSALNNMIAGRNRQIDSLKNELSKQPAEPITPNIVFTIEAIQKMRDEAKAQGAVK